MNLVIAFVLTLAAISGAASPEDGHQIFSLETVPPA
jgi:hypothetical protein